MGQIGSRTNRAAVRVTIDALRAAECLRDRDLALVRLVEATATGLDVASGRHLAPYAPALRLHGPTWRRSPSLMERVEAGEPSSEIERVLAAAMRPSYGSFATRTTPPRAWGDARRTRDRI